MSEKSMLDVMGNILRVISDKYPKWTDVQTGRFVRRAITEDISQEKLVKEIEEVSTNEEVGELLEAYREVKDELLRKAREKASVSYVIILVTQ
jgi:hypothetical protein